MEEVKLCKECNIEYNVDNFYIKRGKPMNMCKICKKKKDKINRDKPENKKKIKDRNNKWNSENKDYFINYNSINDISSYRKDYREKNKNTIYLYNKDYREKNKDKINSYLREYRFINKEKFKNYYEISSNTRYVYKENNQFKIRARQNKYFRERKENDPLFKLSCNIRTLINLSLVKNGYSKNTKSFDIVGISYYDLKVYFESMFSSWMTWKNHGLYNGEFDYGWDIDHIIPLSSVKTEEELLKLNHYTNLQPLCSKVNRDIKKSTL